MGRAAGRPRASWIARRCQGQGGPDASGAESPAQCLGRITAKLSPKESGPYRQDVSGAPVRIDLIQDTNDISVSSATIKQRCSTPLCVTASQAAVRLRVAKVTGPAIQDWLCGEKSLDHLVQALDHDGWWSVFESLRARQTLARESLVPDPVWLVGGGAQFFVA
jgi:hypothetical protein